MEAEISSPTSWGGEKENSARLRIAQAKDAGADIVAVCCPQCARMSEDGGKAEDPEQQMEILDIAGLIARGLQ